MASKSHHRKKRRVTILLEQAIKCWFLESWAIRLVDTEGTRNVDPCIAIGKTVVLRWFDAGGKQHGVARVYDILHTCVRSSLASSPRSFLLQASIWTTVQSMLPSLYITLSWHLFTMRLVRWWSVSKKIGCLAAGRTAGLFSLPPHLQIPDLPLNSPNYLFHNWNLFVWDKSDCDTLASTPLRHWCVMWLRGSWSNMIGLS